MLIYILKAFSYNALGGNAAAVIFNSISERKMQKLARKLNYSETVFVLKSKRADFKLCFFTPVKEIELCGHATIAAFNLMRELAYIELGEYKIETKSGIYRVIVFKNEVFMEQAAPKFDNRIDFKELNTCFNSLLVENKKPIQIVSTGLRDILIPVDNIKILNELSPNLDMVLKISKKYNVVGLHLFTENCNNSDAICRNFAPLYGINEEAATGTSNGALACYLHKYSSHNKSNYLFKQGFNMGLPSEIKVKLEFKADEVSKVYVGGGAVMISKKDIY